MFNPASLGPRRAFAGGSGVTPTGWGLRTRPLGARGARVSGSGVDAREAHA